MTSMPSPRTTKRILLVAYGILMPIVFLAATGHLRLALEELLPESILREPWAAPSISALSLTFLLFALWRVVTRGAARYVTIFRLPLKEGSHDPVGLSPAALLWLAHPVGVFLAVWYDLILFRFIALDLLGLAIAYRYENTICFVVFTALPVCCGPRTARLIYDRHQVHIPEPAIPDAATGA